MFGRGDAVPQRLIVFSKSTKNTSSMHALSTDDGISIPSSYSAFLAPIQSAKLHHEAGGSKDAKEKDREKGLETPYVVMLQAINFLSGDNPNPVHGGRCGGRIQQCWEFVHPRRDALLDSRGTESQFKIYDMLTYCVKIHRLKVCH